jgi:hypothetical protein
MTGLLQLPAVEVVKCNLGITVDDGSVRKSTQLAPSMISIDSSGDFKVPFLTHFDHLCQSKEAESTNAVKR